MENRMNRRLEWAEKRNAKVSSFERRAEPYRGDVAFNTQPGHIPERARLIRAQERAWEDSKMASHHEQKADGIAFQLKRSIFSDDHDAIEKLREKIAGLEADRDRQKAINKEIKRGAGFQARLEAAGIKITERDTADLMSVAKYQPYYCDKKTGLPVFPTYHFSNLGANIRRFQGRLADLEQRQRCAEVINAEVSR
jgi:hypothetical protein